MSKHTARRAKARMIRAAGKAPIVLEAIPVDWIAAAEPAEGEKPKPKRFSMRAYNGGPMQVNNYGPPVAIDLSGMTAKAPVPILREHDRGRVVGHADAVDIGDSSLKLSGIVSGAGPDATEVVAAAGNGFPWRASVGARPDKLEFVGEGVTTKVNGKTLTGPLYVARKSTLGEVSFVALGADRKAIAKVAASAAKQKETSMDFHEWLKDGGFTDTEIEGMRDDQRAFLQAKYDAEVKAAAARNPKSIEGSAKPPVIDAPSFDLSAVILAHESHIATIEATAEEYREKVPAADFAKLSAAARKGAIEAKAKALGEQWPAPRLEAEYIKAAALFKADLMVAERPKGPAIHSSSHDLDGKVIEAAMSQALRLPDVEEDFDDKTLQAAHTEFRGRIGLQQILLIAATANGYVCRPGERIHTGNCRDVLRAAFPDRGPIRAAGTLSLPGLLSGVAQKELLAGFMEEDNAWREIAVIKSVPNFLTMTSYRMLDNMEYEEVPPGGTIKHGSVSEESYTRKANTYGKMFQLDRTDIVNDDLGAFDDIRTRLGRGSARKFNAVFWAAFMNNGSFFTSARGNYISGATTNLGTDYVGLALGITAFDDLKSAAVKPAKTGKRIGGTPTVLLVPPELDAIALQIFQPIAAATTATVNIYAGKYRPVKVYQLSDSTYTGYSSTAWYLLRDPRILAAMVVSFLNGVEGPVIESADVNFDQLGIQFRGYSDFGCDQAEWLCGVKSKGAA